MIGNIDIFEDFLTAEECDFIFNSRLHHRVTQVDNGTRYSLVNWVSLIRADSKKQNLI